MVTDAYPWIITSSHISAISSSPSCLRQAKAWLDYCQMNHPRCGSTHARFPKRLVAVGSPSQLPFLYESRQGEEGTYAALSYCWGKGKTFTTTLHTLPLRKAGFSLESLPNTCRDAIIVARALDIQFVWIDQLCIIQDSEKDWEEQAACMASIYSNATITFAALDSSGADDGLFISESARGTIALSIPLGQDTKMGVVYARKSHERVKLGFLHASEADRKSLSYDGVLESRLWTLQELALSPRVLWFSTFELGWSCKGATACECCPNMSSAHLQDRLPPERILTVQLTESNKNTDWQSTWKDIVCWSTRRHATYETDRLPAMAGLAAQMKTYIGSAYFAGLWEKDLERFLMWSNVRGENRDPDRETPSAITPSYAPSWTWGSTSSAVEFKEKDTMPGFQRLWSLLAVRFWPTTSNPFGPGQGILTMEGYMFPCCIGRYADLIEILAYQGGGSLLSIPHTAWFPDDRPGYNGLKSVQGKDLFFIPTSYCKELHIPLRGLIVEKVYDSPQFPRSLATRVLARSVSLQNAEFYRRVGVLDFPYDWARGFIDQFGRSLSSRGFAKSGMLHGLPNRRRKIEII